MQTERPDDTRLHDGLHYPVGHLIGILRDGQAAEQAAQNLYAAGYTDIVVMEGRAALEAYLAMGREANPLARAWERLSAYLSDDDEMRQVVRDALAQGHSIVMVRAPGEAQEEKAESILRAHGARSLVYYGRWYITDLSR